MPRTAAPAAAEVGAHADVELAVAAAAGEKAAFEELYRRNVPAAWRVAQAVARNRDDASDAVADAFERVFRAVTTGRLCENGSFRPYLLTATRRAAIDISRRARRCESSDEVETLAPATVESEPADRMVGELEARMLMQAFRTLPERWRSVLWLVEVEGLSAQEAAGVLGLKPNNVAQLVVRARAGLRTRYLTAHVDAHARPGCAVAIERLGTYVEGGLGRRRRARVDEHLAGCHACRKRLDELRDLGVTLRRSALPIPVVLGSLGAGGWRRLAASLARPLPGAPGGVPSAFSGSGPVGGWVANAAPQVVAGAPAVERLATWAATGLLVLGVSAGVARTGSEAPVGPDARSGAEATQASPGGGGPGPSSITGARLQGESARSGPTSPGGMDEGTGLAASSGAPGASSPGPVSAHIPPAGALVPTAPVESLAPTLEAVGAALPAAGVVDTVVPQNPGVGAVLPPVGEVLPPGGAVLPPGVEPPPLVGGVAGLASQAVHVPAAGALMAPVTGPPVGQ